MTNIRITALILIILGAFAGFFVYSSQVNPNGHFGKFPFKLGLDLNGGTHLVYQADVSKVVDGDVSGAMDTLRQVIETRINVFGVAEPLVQTEEANVNGAKVEKLIVELPGVTDVSKAVAMIGKTPSLEFKLLDPKVQAAQASSTSSAQITDSSFLDTGLTGEYLDHASLDFNQNTGQPLVTLAFNSKGTDLFSKITKENIGHVLAIFLDGQPISMPVIQQQIPDGKAQINGQFTPDQAKQLVQDLNYGALPVPISLVETQTIGPSLGADAVHGAIMAGFWSFIVIAAFLIFWYRLPGLVAVIALGIYTCLNLAVFKLIPVTLTSAGLAGFILSIGMAVDANILIFERMKEELKKGLSIPDATKEGFHRAWLSIRDSNLSSIITGVILYYFATSSLIRGFALVFVIGVLISMFTAVTVSRTLLRAIGVEKTNKFTRFLWSNGFFNGSNK